MNNFQSLLFYLFGFSLSAFLIHKGQNKKLKILIVVGLLIPILMAGLRYEVGTDYNTYIAYINDIAWHGDFSIHQYINKFSSYLEPTFYLFAQITILLNRYQLIFVIYSAIGVVFLYKAIQNLDTEYSSLIYFLIISIMFPMSFNLMRQFAAITIAMYGITSLIKNDVKKFFLFTILASLFHVSAVVNIFVYILYRIINYRKLHISSKQIVVFVLLSSIFIVSLTCYGLYRYGYLLRLDRMTANLNFIPKFLMILVILLMKHKAPLVWNKNKMSIAIASVSVLLGIIGFFVPYSDRISLYFFPFVLVLLPTAVHEVVLKDKKHLTTMSMVIVGLFYFVASYYILGSHEIIPYRSILG